MGGQGKPQANDLLLEDESKGKDIPFFQQGKDGWMVRTKIIWKRFPVRFFHQGKDGWIVRNQSSQHSRK
jgi:hypothetical protein